MRCGRPAASSSPTVTGRRSRSASRPRARRTTSWRTARSGSGLAGDRGSPASPSWSSTMPPGRKRATHAIRHRGRRLVDPVLALGGPHHRGQAGPAGGQVGGHVLRTERGTEPTDGLPAQVLEAVSGCGEVVPHLGDRPGGEPPMVGTVQTDLMALAHGASHEVRMPGGAVGEDEERRPHARGGQDVQHGGGHVGIGSVVEGEADRQRTAAPEVDPGDRADGGEHGVGRPPKGLAGRRGESVTHSPQRVEGAAHQCPTSCSPGTPRPDRMPPAAPDRDRFAS